jgi:hypothetical protein
VGGKLPRGRLLLRAAAALAVVMVLLDLSLIAAQRAAADPPTTGIVDVRYRWDGTQWERTLVIGGEAGGTCQPPSDPACDFTSNCTWGTGWYRSLASNPGQNEVQLVHASGEGFLDDSFALATKYRYRGAGAMNYTCWVGGVPTGKMIPSADLRIAQIEEATPAHNQSVDSRYDLRYSSPTFVDFQFGDRAWRGGLFAGFANDPSRVGRSYLKFTLPTAPTGSTGRHVSTLNAWFTRLYASGSVNVQARRSTNTTWTENGVVWSTAPTFGNAEDTQTVTYNPGSGDNGLKWIRWKVHDDVEAAYGESATALTEVLTSASETTNGWAYFAKRQYESGKEPRLFVVFNF